MIIMFQFQYGAIIREVGQTYYLTLVVFQFQYGAIISKQTNTMYVCHAQFQFQYGAIIRENEQLKKYNEECFNSNMVRL